MSIKNIVAAGSCLIDQSDVGMRFKMSISDALRIQYEQLEWYAQAHSIQDMSEAICLMTRTELLGDVDYEQMMDVCEVNSMVPRGWIFEGLWQKRSPSK